MKAKLTTYHQAPRKTRLVADLVRGKTVAEALEILSFLPKKVADPMKRLIASAAANHGGNKEQLVVKKITVDKSIIMKRYMPRARGSSSMIRHRTSHVKVELATKAAAMLAK